MLPSLQLQLTSVSYSVFYYLSHSILLLKPKPKNCPLFPCSSTSNPSQSAISSTAESVCSSPFCLPLIQSWTSYWIYPPSVLFPSNQLITWDQSEHWHMVIGSTVFQLTSSCGFPLFTDFNPKSLPWSSKSYRMSSLIPCSLLPGSLCLTTHVFLLIVGCYSGLNWAPMPKLICWSSKPPNMMGPLGSN